MVYNNGAEYTSAPFFIPICYKLVQQEILPVDTVFEKVL